MKGVGMGFMAVSLVTLTLQLGVFAWIGEHIGVVGIAFVLFVFGFMLYVWDKSED